MTRRQRRSFTFGPHRRAADSVLALAVVLLPALVAAPSALGQATVQVLYAFKGGTDGGSPQAGLARDTAGNLYGTTYGSGAGYGVVFKIDTAGNESVLHSFTGPPDGAYPQAGLVLDGAGNLYGTTSLGGASTNCPGVIVSGCGTVFKVSATGTETVLHSFTGPADGEYPEAGLLLDAGNLYGTTFKGGAYGKGMIFELTTTGKETPLYSFGEFTGDGLYPSAVLIADGAYLYGTTQGGGTSELGTVFNLDTTNNKETVLYSFKGYPDGATPESGLVQDTAGNLYGTTSSGGAGEECLVLVGCGTVFKLDVAGSESVLYKFGSVTNDGNEPIGGLALDAEDNVYGTAYGGGEYGYGTLFEVSQAGKETVSYSLNPSTQGGYPDGGLILEKGHFGGIASSGMPGSTTAYGTVFEFIP